MTKRSRATSGGSQSRRCFTGASRVTGERGKRVAVAFAGTQWRAIRSGRAILRFDSALALNVHFHALVLDGAYWACPDSMDKWSMVFRSDFAISGVK